MSPAQHIPQHMYKVRFNTPSPWTLPHHLSPQTQGFFQAAGSPNSEGTGAGKLLPHASTAHIKLSLAQ